MHELLPERLGAQSKQIYQEQGQDGVRYIGIGVVLWSICGYHFLEDTRKGTGPLELPSFDPACSKRIPK